MTAWIYLASDKGASVGATRSLTLRHGLVFCQRARPLVAPSDKMLLAFKREAAVVPLALLEMVRAESGPDRQPARGRYGPCVVEIDGDVREAFRTARSGLGHDRGYGIVAGQRPRAFSCRVLDDASASWAGFSGDDHDYPASLCLRLSAKGLAAHDAYGYLFEYRDEYLENPTGLPSELRPRSTSP